MTNKRRRLSVGAELDPSGAHFRVFAPKRTRVEVVIEAGGRTVQLTKEEDNGHFSGLGDGIKAGTLYRLRLDSHAGGGGGGAGENERLFPDPASRFQPDGPHGPSEIIDPTQFRWTDQAWRGPAELRGQVVYEMHIGTFTKEGTFASAMRELEALRDLGITLLEVMPVAEFPGRFGWGYDGVDLYAPTHLYGRPDDFRAFVDRAHALNMGVILDVVYNHLGPSGNYLRELSDDYFTDRYENEWGDAIDFETSPGARDYFAQNGAYWIDEYHLDGLRLDATQSIHDKSSGLHIITEIGQRARAAAANSNPAAPRSILLFAENERQEAELARSVERGGHGLDAVWNDDFHHSARVAATGRAEAYYSSTKGTPQELISAVKWGYLFQGQLYTWQKNRRGTPALDLPAPTFTLFLENHDQVANSAQGERLHQLTSPGIHRAMTTLLLLAPGTPMLFQGQEWASSKPFVYFADHEPDLAKLVSKGRLEFLKQFPSLKDFTPSTEPHELATFERCKLDHSERTHANTNTHHASTHRLFADLLRLRREDVVFAAQDRDALHGAVIGPHALALRFATGSGSDRLLLMNLGHDIDAGACADPLLAPPTNASSWRLVFSSEDMRYGGSGTPGQGPHGEMLLPAGSALVFGPDTGDDTGDKP